METDTSTKCKFRFGLFVVDPRTGELHKGGVRRKLQAQPFRILVTLLEHTGDVVSREELRQILWGDSITVDFDHRLGTAINKLREVLDDSADNPRFVETLPGRGYRFIAPVTLEGAEQAPASIQAPRFPDLR